MAANDYGPGGFPRMTFQEWEVRSQPQEQLLTEQQYLEIKAGGEFERRSLKLARELAKERKLQGGRNVGLSVVSSVEMKNPNPLPVPAMISCLEQELEACFETLDELYARCGEIVKPEMDGKGENATVDDADVSETGGRLRRIRNRLELLRARIYTLTGRLDL